MAMQPITFDIVLFKDKQDSQRSKKAMLYLLEALSQVNLTWLQKYPTLPLYKTRVVYEAEETEIWKDVPNVLNDGYGDCEDLACWRVAELRKAGIAARPYISWRTMPSGAVRFHALVLRPDGRIEDPSLALGMHGKITRRPVFVKQ